MTDPISIRSVSRRQRLVTACLTSVAATCLLVGPGVSAEEMGVADASDWMTQSYPYLVVDQPLDAVLKEFGHNVGIDVDISDRLTDRVSHYRHDAGSREFLEGLASSYNFEWFFDGRRLHMSARDEATDKVWSVGPGVEDDLTSALSEVGAYDSRFPIRFDSTQGTVRLSGPPAYMALAMPVVDSFVEPTVARTVNVIHGRARSGGS